MNGVNKAIVVGRLGRDPEVKTLGSGKKMASFSVATSDNWKDKQTGERQEHTDWHNVVVFDAGLVEIVEHTFRKGANVYVEGKMQTRKWVDKRHSDVQHYATEIVCTGFGAKLFTTESSGEGRPGPSGEGDYGSGDARPRGGNDGASRYDADDDIPF